MPSNVCEICHEENEVRREDRYSGWTCTCCGQPYDYDEGTHITLSAKQVAVLRLNWIQQREDHRG